MKSPTTREGDMRTTDSPRRGRAAACLFAVLSLSLVLTAWGARVRLPPARGGVVDGAPLPSAEPPAPVRPDRDGVEVEVLTLSPGGFEPAEVTRPAARFLLAVNNHAGGEAVSLLLARVKGERLREVKMGRGRVRSVNELQLPPGEYLLTVEGHPEWSCRITLTSR